MKDIVYLMGGLYVFAGINHFIFPLFYKKMIANFLPYPLHIVYISGLIEILLGIGICIPELRQFSAWGIICLLICIFPANINLALRYHKSFAWSLLLYLRLPVQFLLIYWAYLYTKT
jgi:uncharacterized membrane protein